MPYERPWSSSAPGLIIFLLDQSRSMARSFGGTQLGSGRKKSFMVATVLNSLIQDVIKINMVGTSIRPRAEIAVLGFGGRDGDVHSALGEPLCRAPYVSLSDLVEHPLRIEMRSSREIADDGQPVDVPIYFPVWVDPVNTGDTPMCSALLQAASLAAAWSEHHRESYPPVVINVSDGGASDGDLRVAARALAGVSTEDGQALFFNCHITDKPSPPIEFPLMSSSLPYDKHAELLFSVSSPIPDMARQNLAAQGGLALPPGARGMVFNGDAGSVRQMFRFASLPLLDRSR